ncbi:MAG TPA: putative toxin-antitoxin system toxin component, PIN family [Chloroflexia bacterium]|nr:putative toxin-antitoxin system toxin component, PIN family [Chloroflexia bacterium]
MKVVLDSNIVVSRFIVAKGKSAQIIKLWEDRRFTLLVSEPLLQEYRRVMAYKRVRLRHGLTDKEIEEAINPFSEYATIIKPTVQIEAVRDDPDDDKVLECAIAGEADYIVSGDAHLLNLGEYQTVKILAPAAFLLLFEQIRIDDAAESSQEGQT